MNPPLRWDRLLASSKAASSCAPSPTSAAASSVAFATEARCGAVEAWENVVFSPWKHGDFTMKLEENHGKP